MGLLSVGLIFLLIGIGYFLSWGNSGTNANVVFDVIMGAIFVIIGFGFIRYKNPVEDATKKIANTMNRIMDDSANKISSSREAQESVKRIEADTQEAVREIRESARMRVHQIAKDIEDLTANAGGR